MMLSNQQDPVLNITGVARSLLRIPRESRSIAESRTPWGNCSLKDDSEDNVRRQFKLRTVLEQSTQLETRNPGDKCSLVRSLITWWWAKILNCRAIWTTTFPLYFNMLTNLTVSDFYPRFPFSYACGGASKLVQHLPPKSFIALRRNAIDYY
ncbi:hypothetical protein AZE42_04523 [Rhizopogon vesiculosus]|uniref:Uncharacterized protein n=1 Tax=Rhizopogon vesiculosus TaxID=180088 RepID=A0A1J8QMK8_9AGAM|nr:hypothetical protein AZE42_04523 [Rhizopogon vesiculosus]